MPNKLTINDIIAQLEAIKADEEKADLGNQSAAKRLRTALQTVKKMCHELRSQSLQASKEV